MIDKIKGFQYYALFAAIVLSVCIFVVFLYKDLLLHQNIVKYEVTIVKSKDDKSIKLDSLQYLKLENAIQQVEKKNDGRFEVLTWSSVLVLTVIALLLTINFFVSESKVKELVDKAIDEKTNKIIASTQEVRKQIEENADEIEKIYAKLKELLNNYQSENNEPNV